MAISTETDRFQLDHEVGEMAPVLPAVFCCNSETKNLLFVISTGQESQDELLAHYYAGVCYCSTRVGEEGYCRGYHQELVYCGVPLLS